MVRLSLDSGHFEQASRISGYNLEERAVWGDQGQTRPLKAKEQEQMQWRGHAARE